MTNLDVRDLRYFVAIAELGHLGRASQILHRTQPALTKCIQRLEDGLGGALFDRRGRGMELTSLGHAFLTRARNLVQNHDRDLSDMQAISGGFAGKVRVGFGPITAEYILPVLADLVIQDESRIELEIVIGTTNALKDRLREKTLDVLIGGVVKEAGFTSHPLLNDVVVVVARDTHPIFRLEDIQLEDLLDYEWILPSSQISSRIWLDNLFWSRRLPKARVRIESNALPTIHGLIARTDFLSFLSRLTFEHPRNRGSLREVPVAAARLDRPLGITYPTDELTAASKKTVSLLLEHFIA